MPFLGLDYGDVVAVAVKTAAAPLRGRLRRALTATPTTHQRGQYEEGPNLKPAHELSRAGAARSNYTRKHATGF